MPTVNFSGNDAAIVFSPKTSIHYQSFGNIHGALMSGSSSSIDTIVTGTACTMTTYVGNGGGWTMVLDGVSSSLTIPQNNAWITLELFTGLSDTPHRLTLIAGGNNEYVEIETNSGLFQVTGSAPAVSLPTGYSQNQWMFNDATVKPHISYEGLNTILTGNYSLLFAGYSGAAIRFKASGDTIKLWMFSRGQTLYVGVDGAPLSGPIIAPDTNTFQWVTVVTSGGTDAHEYNVYMGYKGTSGQGLYVYGVMTIGGTGLDLTWAPATRFALALYGDSITEGISDSVAIGCYSYLFDKYNSDVLKTANRAQSGSTVQTRGINSVSEVTSISPTPKWCIVQYGTNDLSDGRSTSNFQADYYTMINALTAGLPTTQFFVVGLIPRSSNDVSAYNTAIQAVIGDGGNGSGSTLTADQKALITYIDPSNWRLSGSSGTDFSTNYIDGLHPNSSGNQIIYDHLFPFLALRSELSLPAVYSRETYGYFTRSRSRRRMPPTEAQWESNN